MYSSRNAAIPGPPLSATEARRLMNRNIEPQAVQFAQNDFQSKEPVSKQDLKAQSQFATARVSRAGNFTSSSNHCSTQHTQNSASFKAFYEHSQESQATDETVCPGLVSSEEITREWGPFRLLHLLLSDSIVGFGWHEKYLVLNQVFSEALSSRSQPGEPRLTFDEFERIMTLYPSLGKASLRDLFSFLDTRRKGLIEETEFISGMLASSPDTRTFISRDCPKLRLILDPSRGGSADITTTEYDTGISPITLVRLQMIFLRFDADGDGRLNLCELTHLVTQILTAIASAKRAGRVFEAPSLEAALGPCFRKVIEPLFLAALKNERGVPTGTQEHASNERTMNKTTDKTTESGIQKKSHMAKEADLSTFFEPARKTFEDIIGGPMKRIFGDVGDDQLSEGRNREDIRKKKSDHRTLPSGKVPRPKNVSSGYSHSRRYRKESQTKEFYVGSSKDGRGLLPKRESTSQEMKSSESTSCNRLATTSSMGSSLAAEVAASISNGAEIIRGWIPYISSVSSSGASLFGRTCTGDTVEGAGFFCGLDDQETSSEFRIDAMDDTPTLQINGSMNPSHDSEAHYGCYYDSFVEPHSRQQQFSRTEAKHTASPVIVHRHRQRASSSQTTPGGSTHQLGSSHTRSLSRDGKGPSLWSNASYVSHGSSLSTPFATHQQLEIPRTGRRTGVSTSHPIIRGLKHSSFDEPISIPATGRHDRGTLGDGKASKECHLSRVGLQTTTTSTSIAPTSYESFEEPSDCASRIHSLESVTSDMLDCWRKFLAEKIAQELIAEYDIYGDRRGICFAEFIHALRENDIPGTELLFRTREDFVSVVERHKAALAPSREASMKNDVEQSAVKREKEQGPSQALKNNYATDAVGILDLQKLHGNKETKTMVELHSSLPSESLSDNFFESTVLMEPPSEDHKAMDSTLSKEKEFSDSENEVLMDRTPVIEISTPSSRYMAEATNQEISLTQPNLEVQQTRSAQQQCLFTLNESPNDRYHNPPQNDSISLIVPLSRRRLVEMLSPSHDGSPVNGGESFRIMHQRQDVLLPGSSSILIDLELPSSERDEEDIESVLMMGTPRIGQQRSGVVQSTTEQQPLASQVVETLPDSIQMDPSNGLAWKTVSLLQSLAESHERHISLARRTIATVHKLTLFGWKGPSISELSLGAVEEVARELSCHRAPFYLDGQVLPLRFLLNLCDAVVEVFRYEPLCIELKGPAYIINSPLENKGAINSIGDLASTQYSIHHMLETFMFGKETDSPENTPSVIIPGHFAFATRNTECLELIGLLFAMKLLYPSKLILLRGPTEDFFVASAYGLDEECCARYGDVDGRELLRRLFDALEFLPMCASIPMPTANVSSSRNPQSNKTRSALVLAGDVPSQLFSSVFHPMTHSSHKDPIPSLMLSLLPSPKQSAATIPDDSGRSRPQKNACTPLPQSRISGGSPSSPRSNSDFLSCASEVYRTACGLPTLRPSGKGNKTVGRSCMVQTLNPLLEEEHIISSNRKQESIQNKGVLDNLKRTYFEMVWGYHDMLAFNRRTRNDMVDFENVEKRIVDWPSIETPRRKLSNLSDSSFFSSTYLNSRRFTAQWRSHFLEIIRHDVLIRPDGRSLLSFETKSDLGSERLASSRAGSTLKIGGAKIEAINQKRGDNIKFDHIKIGHSGFSMCHKPRSLPTSRSSSPRTGHRVTVRSGPSPPRCPAKEPKSPSPQHVTKTHSSFRNVLRSVMAATGRRNNSGSSGGSFFRFRSHHNSE